MNRAGIYVRLSDEDRDKKVSSDESESIQNQKSMLIAYCLERGWEIYSIYCDEDYSGADRNRPGFNAMIKDCEEGRINIVVCKTQSRFSRDMEIIERYIHGKFFEWKIRFISIVDHADTDVQGNKKARQINGLINEWYLEDLSDNIKRTLNHKKREGQFCGAFAPYGYMKDPGDKNQLIVDPIAAKVVRDIFRMFTNGLGYQRIVQELNVRGVLTPTYYKKSKGANYHNPMGAKAHGRNTGSMWTIQTIYEMVRNETYIGTLVQGKWGTVSYKNQKTVLKPKNEWVCIPDSHEPIIDENTWVLAQSKLRTKTRPQEGSGVKHVFSGKIFCAHCGNSMAKTRYQTKEGVKEYYRCRTPWNAPHLCQNTKVLHCAEVVELVRGEINNLLGKYHNAELVNIESDNGQKDNFEQERKMVQDLIVRKENAIETLFMDRADGIISTERYVQLQGKLEDEIVGYKVRLAEIEKEMAAKMDDKASYTQLIKKYKHIKTLTHQVVDEFIEKVEVMPYDEGENLRNIKVYWKF